MILNIIYMEKKEAEIIILPIVVLTEWLLNHPHIYNICNLFCFVLSILCVCVKRATRFNSLCMDRSGGVLDMKTELKKIY
jgi:hypothetical protein